MNTKILCPFCLSLKVYIYFQSYYQCLNSKKVVEDCCSGENGVYLNMTHLTNKINNN